MDAARCLNQDKIYVRSDDKNLKNTAKIKINLRHCSDKPHCKSPEEIKKYWWYSSSNSYSQHTVIITYGSNYIDMKNFTNPV